MKIFKYIGYTLYRIWFYVLIAVAIFLLLPFLLLSILKESWYPFFFKVARIWASMILIGMALRPVIKRDIQYVKGQPYMFVANHASMMDIMLMYYATKNPFVFVGKKELAKLPLFGFFYKRTCILVDRSDPKSRHGVFSRAQKKLDQGLSICIFPEGGVPDDGSIVLNSFKDGAFRLAIEHKIPIAPMTFHDTKKRFSYTFFSGSPGRLRVKIHEVLPTVDYTLNDKRTLKEKTREIILNELKQPTV